MSDAQENKGQVIIPLPLAQQYAKTKNVSLEKAYSDLEANFKRESEGVDLAQQYQALIKAYRVMSPQLNGVVSRETDMANSIKTLTFSVKCLKDDVERLQNQIEMNKTVFRQAMDLLNGIVVEDSKTMKRIADLEAKLGTNNLSLWGRVKRVLGIK